MQHIGARNAKHSGGDFLRIGNHLNHEADFMAGHVAHRFTRAHHAIQPIGADGEGVAFRRGAESLRLFLHNAAHFFQEQRQARDQ